MTAPGRTLPTLRQETSDRVFRWSLPRPSWREEFISVLPLADEPPPRLVERAVAAMRDARALPLKMTFFGDRLVRHQVLQLLSGMLDPRASPVTWVEGASAQGEPVAGLHVHAVTGVEPDTLTEEGRPVARVCSSEATRMAVLADVAPPDRQAPARDQAYALYRVMERNLLRAGFTFHDVCRTWLFVDHILEWYPGLNEARNRFFTERCVYHGLVPASTGIGCANATGHALLAEALAIQSVDGQLHIAAVDSPLQCTALTYGSAFSRAVEISGAGARQLLVSGTASIGPDGSTLHAGDPARQIQRTMDVVRTLLQSRGYQLEQTTRAVAYVKRPGDAPLFGLYLQEHGLEQMPVITVIGDICRHDLLFEIELDAVAAVPDHQPR